MPERPSTQPCQNSSTLLPSGVSAPMPVMTTRRVRCDSCFGMSRHRSGLRFAVTLLARSIGRVALQAEDVGAGLAGQGD